MTNEGRITVLLADDHAVMRSGLRLLIDNQPDMRVIGEAGDGLQAIDQAAALQPDVVLLDLTMPRLDGLASRAIASKLTGQCSVAIMAHPQLGVEPCHNRLVRRSPLILRKCPIRVWIEQKIINCSTFW